MRFQKGEDVAVDLTEAAKWYGMAAENENAEAQFYMANAYSAGTGVKQDDEKAANWYRQAAEQGHFFAPGKCREKRGMRRKNHREIIPIELSTTMSVMMGQI